MIRKKVWRYYCEFCKKSNCSGGSISKHEKHCTMNPNRICRMCKMVDHEQQKIENLLSILPNPDDYRDVEFHDYGSFDVIEMVEVEVFNGLDLAVDKVLPKLREITGNCPACILASLRQKGIPVPCVQNFDFKNEVDQVWADINDANADNYGYY
jgi:hypothetical protein